MRDAESAHPICGDRYARQFMDARGLEIFRQFGGESAPNASNVARHRYIDDYIREQLASDSRLQIVLLGCGFDSRAFRLQGGSWFELDEPQLIAYKNQRLSARESPNPLQRIPIDFTSDTLREKLQPLDVALPALVVIEGVTMYLSAESLRHTLQQLKSILPQHRVIADLMTRAFIERYGRAVNTIIAQLGARMIPGNHPAQPFQQAGYRQLASSSIVGLALAYRKWGAVNPVLRLLLPGAYAGYTVRLFEPVT